METQKENPRGIQCLLTFDYGALLLLLSNAKHTLQFEDGLRLRIGDVTTFLGVLSGKGAPGY